MKTTISRPRVLVVIVGLATVLAACGSSSKSPSSTSGPSGASGATGEVSATLNGSGSTFQKVFDEAVISAFQSSHSKITVNYSPVGSGTGKTNLQTKGYVFAGTDSLPKPDELSSYQGGALLYFPTVAAPITVSYNLSGLPRLKFSGTTLAKIFSLKIKQWNDGAIVADNPGVSLPSTAITVVHRADGSGTTHNFTQYLADVDPTDWTLGAGDKANWAALPGTTLSGTGNSGVAQGIKGTTGAIGYVDLADASAAGLTTALVKNKAGSYLAPTVAGASAAVAGTTVNADLSYEPINATGAAAYPITSPTWIIAYVNQKSYNTGTALKEFLQFIYADGQTLAPTVGFAALPPAVVQKATAQLAKLVIPAT